MNKFSLGVTCIIRKIVAIFFVSAITVLFFLNIVDGSLTEVAGIEWIFGSLAAVGLTMVLGTVTYVKSKEYYFEIDNDSLKIVYGKKSMTVAFTDIVCVNIVTTILFFGGSRVIIETGKKAFTFELDNKDLEKVKALLPKVNDKLESVEMKMRLTVKDKLKTLLVWVLDATLYLLIIACIFIPIALCALKKYSAQYSKMVGFSFTALAVVYAIILVFIFIVYLYKINHYSSYELEVGGGEVVMRCKNPDARVFRTDKSQIVGFTETTGILGRVLGYVTAKIITKSESKGLNEVNYLPFMIKKEQAKRLRTLLIEGSGETKLTSSGVKCDVVAFEFIFIASVVSIVFSILYNPIFLLVFVLEGILYVLYRFGRGYAVGQDFLRFRTGTVWKKDYYIVCGAVCSVTTTEDIVREIFKVSGYIFDVGGYRAQFPVGVYDKSLRDKIKEKIGI